MIIKKPKTITMHAKRQHSKERLRDSQRPKRSLGLNIDSIFENQSKKINDMYQNKSSSENMNSVGSNGHIDAGMVTNYFCFSKINFCF